MHLITGALVIEFFAVNLFLSTLLAFWISKKYGLFASQGILVSCFSAFQVLSYHCSQYRNEPIEVFCSLCLSASCALLFLFSLIFAMQALDQKTWIKIILGISLVNSASIFIFHKSGLLLNASMSGCFAATTLPLFFTESRNKYCFALPLFVAYSVLYSGQSQPIALLFISVAVFLAQKGYWKSILGAVAASLLVGYCVAGKDLFDPSGRTEFWKTCFDFWHAHADPVLGMGLGNFSYTGPYLVRGFIYLHSDWAQILFELGWLGFVLAVLTYLNALVQCRKNGALFNSLVICGFYGVANFPMHNPVSAILVVFLLHSALERRKNEPEAFEKVLGIIRNFRRTLGRKR